MRRLKFYISNFIDYALLGIILFGGIITIIFILYFACDQFIKWLFNSGDVN